MPEPVTRLSFGDTSVGSLLSAVRDALPPGAATLDWQRVSDATSARVERIVESSGHMVRDAPGKQWLRTCAIVLGAYRELEPFVPGPQLVAMFLDAMAAPFRERIASYLESRFGISQDAPEEAF